MEISADLRIPRPIFEVAVRSSNLRRGIWLAGLLCLICPQCRPDRPCDSIGRPCTSDSHCDCGFCLPKPGQKAADLQPVALACGEMGTGAPPAARCDRASDCARGICLLAGTCALACESELDCEPLQRCDTGYARTSAASFQPVNVCFAVADLPARTELRINRFEQDSGKSGELEMSAVEESTLFVIEPLGWNGWPAFNSCRSPICIETLSTRDIDPVPLFDAAQYARPWSEYNEEELPLNPVAVGGTEIDYQSYLATILLPNGPRSVLSEAGFVARFAAERNGAMRVTELASHGSGSLLDLNLFFVGGQNWKSEGERGPALVSAALDQVAEIFIPAGIRIDKVKQIDVTGALRSRFEAIAMRNGVLEDLPELFKLSAGAGNAALNLFLVRELQGLNGSTIAISGGIPGPQTMHGTGASGIAISADSLDQPDALGRVIAHEIGHMLGLFHTSESNGMVIDPLPDTPECRLDHDTDGDGKLSPEECDGWGTDNLMFWANRGGIGLTADQTAVLRTAPVLR
jgi:hypothetical protein